MYGLLDGMRVVECASFIAAPSCALHLHQLGAEVIRIDPVGGGPDFRRWPVTEHGDSLYWEGLNKGKKSVAIDLSKPQGRELAADIIAAAGENAGLFVTNFPREGFLAHEKLSRRRGDLITVRVAGWSDGEPAVDYTINAAIGVPMMTGATENLGKPVNHVLPAWDLMAGAYAAFSALAAERQRRVTGRGQEVIVPLSDIAIASLGHMGQIAEVLATGDRPRIGNDLFGAFGRDFPTSDGQRVMLVAITARQWAGLVDALRIGPRIDHLEQALGVSFAADEGIRFRHREPLFTIVGEAVAAQSLQALRTAFEAKGVCWAPYRTLAAALREEPRFSAAQPLFSTIDHPSGRRYPAPGAAATFVGAQRRTPVRAPYLGEHTDQVLADVLGMGSAQIGALHDAGLVASASAG